MKKDELIKEIDFFLNQARDANCFYNIIEQFKENRYKYYDEMNVSSAFYSYTNTALIIAVFMELSKIYDNHSRSTNIKKILEKCKENISYFPTNRGKKEVTMEGINKTIIHPFQHRVTEEEKEFFHAELMANMEFRKLHNEKALPIVDMTIEKYFELYEWKYKRIESIINNLHKQRNKIYAHNDRDTLNASMDDIIQKFPLNYTEIESLISFALEFCRFAYAMLTDVNKAIIPINIEDWTNTLELVRVGKQKTC